MSAIDNFLQIARNHRASDLHIVAGSPVLMRVKRELVPISLEALTREASKYLTYSLMDDSQVRQFEETLDFDLMIADPERNRYRMNVSYNDGAVGAVIRILPGIPKPLEELRLPALVTEMAAARKGLVLITGSTSQGKSTTMAGIIDHINTNHRRHIVTIEDPIEYVHYNKSSVIRQRDIGRDTQSFAQGLRAALRQDPDVIAIGEMRDYETIKTALTAAEAGVLVLSSMHVISVDKIVARLLSYAPDGSDGHMRALITESLLCVIHQELLPATDGGKRVACETLVVTDAVRNTIRTGNAFNLRNQIATGKRHGMQTMKTSLDELLAEGAIAQQTYDDVLKNYA